MNIRAILMLCALILITAPIAAQVHGFLKDPAISPDGNQVCFVYDDDLWVVSFDGGVARRLTDTKANEWGPIWSPNGKEIAFISNREGRSYPYLIPAEGGEASVIIRESYQIADWFNDGRHLLALRGNHEFGSSFYKLPISGERPLLLGKLGERWASLSPDNSQIVFSRYGSAHREAYTGSLNGDLWSLDIASGEYSRLTRTDYSERYPRFSHISNSLFYSYSDGQSYQLTRVDDMDFGRPFQASNLPRFSARDLSIARANDRIVFEHFNELYKYDPTKLSGDKIEKLEIRIAQDIWENPMREFSMKDEIVDFAVSDDELLVAFTYKYDNFIVPRKGGVPRQITFDHSGWANMIFWEDREMILSKLDNGREKLFSMTVDEDLSLKPLKWFGADSLSVQDLVKDSEGRWLIKYQDYQSAGKVAIADKDSKKLRPINAPGVVTSNFAINKSGTHGVYCSIDNKYYFRGLYLYDFAKDTHHKLLADDRHISNIHWSKDNRSLIFSRAGNLHRLDLVPRDEFEYDEDHWVEIFADPEELTKDEEKKKDKDKEDKEDEEITVDEDGLYVMQITADDEDEEEGEAPPVEIVWEGLDKRLVELYQASLSQLSVVRVLSDSTFLFLDRSWMDDKEVVIYKGDIYGKDKKEEGRLDQGSMGFKLVGKKLYYLENFALKSYDTGSGTKDDISIAMDYEFNVRDLNTRVFEQAWGIFADNFYDPDFHGQDWQTLYDEYRPFVEDARDISDVANIIDEMVGDLNASHTGFYPRRDEELPYKSTASIGAEFDYSERLKRGVRISRVFPQTRLAAIYKVKAGDILTHIDDEEILPDTPLDALLLDKVGKNIRFRILQDGKELLGDIRGLSYRDQYDMFYDFKVNRSRKMVESATDGRVAYIHVPAMGTEDYHNFYQDFFRNNHDKDALILDFRGNRGGRVHDQIISLLTKEIYAYSRSRTFGQDFSPEPRIAIRVPTVVLVDEKSFSDGEIFPIVYKELKLGKVIGYPSSGAVIGTVERSLLDGSRMRMPRNGWFKVDGTNMEGTGAIPDILVEHSINDIVQNNDKQLARAIQEILKEIE